MKYNGFYQKRIGCNNESQVFNFLIRHLKETINLWNYFANWGKIIGNIKDIEISLNALNYLVGKSDIESEFKYLLRKHPNIIEVFPILIACRNTSLKVLVDYSSGKFEIENFDFNLTFGQISESQLDSSYKFLDGVGLLDLLKNKTIKSLPDYVLGVEVGLDTNARKNRGGTTMETIVEGLIKPICSRKNYQLLIQPKSKDIFQKWGKKIQSDKANRIFDFAIRTSNEIYVIETNYYGGTGSKLKSTAGEYQNLFDLLKPVKFIWITDGKGWEKTQPPLRETFNHIDHLLNLEMIATGVFEDILSNEF